MVDLDEIAAAAALRRQGAGHARGKTVITIAHRLATVRHADQILVVDDGRIVQSGTHDELVRQDGVYRRFTEIRARAEGWTIA